MGFCEGCQYCTEFYGTGTNYLKTTEFVYILKGDKKALEKVCLALMIDLDKEAETAKQDVSSRNSTRQPTAPNPPPPPSIFAPSEFIKFVPGTARSSTSHYNRQSDFANLVFSPDVSNQPNAWPASSAIASLNSTNGFLWSASSAVMLSARGMVERLRRLFEEPHNHVLSSQSSNNSNEKVD